MAFEYSPYGGNNQSGQRAAALRAAEFALDESTARRIISAEVVVFENGMAKVSPRERSLSGVAVDMNIGRGVRFPWSQVKAEFEKHGFKETAHEPVRESGHTGLSYEVCMFVRLAQ